MEIWTKVNNGKYRLSQENKPKELSVNRDKNNKRVYYWFGDDTFLYRKIPFHFQVSDKLR
jgi:hypothetical protein